MKKSYRIAIISVAVILVLAAAATILYYAVYRPMQKERLKQMLQQYYNDKLTLYQQENKQYAPGQVDVVFLGDSLTDGYDLSQYYSEFTTLNRGISGDTTFGLEARLQVSVYDVQPKVAVMLIGANNFNTMFDNYERILQGFQQNLPNTEIVLLSLTSMGGDWGHNNQIAAYNNVKIRLLAEKYGYAFVDLYGPLMDVSTGEIYAHYTTDGGHLTAAGYEVLSAQIKPVLTELLGK